MVPLARGLMRSAPGVDVGEVCFRKSYVTRLYEQVDSLEVPLARFGAKGASAKVGPRGSTRSGSHSQCVPHCSTGANSHQTVSYGFYEGGSELK